MRVAIFSRCLRAVGRIKSRFTCGWLSNMGAERDSIRTSISSSACQLFNAARHGVISTVSPIERNRTSSTRRAARVSSGAELFMALRHDLGGILRLRLIDQHYGNVVTDRIN